MNIISLFYYLWFLSLYLSLPKYLSQFTLSPSHTQTLQRFLSLSLSLSIYPSQDSIYTLSLMGWGACRAPTGWPWRRRERTRRCVSGKSSDLDGPRQKRMAARAAGSPPPAERSFVEKRERSRENVIGMHRRSCFVCTLQPQSQSLKVNELESSSGGPHKPAT